eukprot:6095142-Lingulodinium_polyedra.AAC.1
MAAPARPSAGRAPEPRRACAEKSHSRARVSAVRMSWMALRRAGEDASRGVCCAAHLARLSTSSFHGWP